MTKVTITPQRAGSQAGFRAAGRGRETIGATPGAALDLLAQQLGPEQSNTLIVVQNMRPDEFFTAAQQQRLSELLAQRRAALDGGPEMPSADKAELQNLIDAELDGAARRASAMIHELQS